MGGWGALPHAPAGGGHPLHPRWHVLRTCLTEPR